MMFKVGIGSDDFLTGSTFVKLGNVASAIEKVLLANGSPNKFQAERDAWPFIHTGIVAGKLHPLAPETLDVLSINDYGNGVVGFDELVEWGQWCKRFEFVRHPALSAQDEYVPLFSLLEGYWDKPLSELPKSLQARVGGRIVKRVVGHKPKFDANGELECDAEGRYPVWEKVHSEHHEAGDFIVSWDALTPDQRQTLARQIDYQNDPKNAEEQTYYWNLVCEKNAIEREIREWELMHHQNVPSEAKIQRERLSELRVELAEVERRFKLPPPAAVEQAAPTAKCEDAPATTPAPTAEVQAAPDATVGTNSKANIERISVPRQQDKAILEWLRLHEYDPMKMPVQRQGMPGVRKICRDAFWEKSTDLFLSKKVFNTAWQRLRDNGDMADVK